MATYKSLLIRKSDGATGFIEDHERPLKYLGGTSTGLMFASVHLPQETSGFHSVPLGQLPLGFILTPGLRLSVGIGRHQEGSAYLYFEVL